MNKQTLQNILHSEIPLTREIGIKVTKSDTDQLILSAPLEPNINHKHTAFGGSLYSVAVLCGWAFLYKRLHDFGLRGHIVIASSEMQYLSPVTSEIIAECKAPMPNTWDRFLKIYRNKGRSRIALQINVFEGGTVACILHGRYVVHA